MGWWRNEPVGPVVTTVLNQMLRSDRAAPAHRVMPTMNRGVSMAPDMPTDAALAEAGLSYLDTVTGTLAVSFIDGDYFEAMGVSKREYLNFRKHWTMARGTPQFISIKGRAQLNAGDIASATFAPDIDEAAQLHRAISEGRASVDDLRSFATHEID